MTQFTEAFYKAYYNTNKDLEVAKWEWGVLAGSLRVDAESFIKITLAHGNMVQLYERLVQLESLWGVYCVNYTADAKTEADRTYVEAECLKELNIIMEQK